MSPSTTSKRGTRETRPGRWKDLITQYTVMIEPEASGGLRGRTLELPFVVGFGPTADRCVQALQKSLALALDTLVDQGQEPPAPARDAKRDEQINIKLTKHERAFLTEAARGQGFRSIADFLRSLAMRQLR